MLILKSLVGKARKFFNYLHFFCYIRQTVKAVQVVLEFRKVLVPIIFRVGDFAKIAPPRLVSLRITLNKPPMVRTYFFQIEHRKNIVHIVVFDAVEPLVVDERSVVGALQIFDDSHHVAKAAVAVECDDVGHIKRCQFFFGVGHAVRIIPPAASRDGRNIVVRS